MHLVSWDILKKPIHEGGLQICGPGLTNLVLGGNILWHLYVDKNHPVSKIFRLKYLKGDSMRNLKTSSSPSGTAILNLCIKGIDNFNQLFFRIPSNGKNIRLWEDKISGNTLLSYVIMLEEIKV